MSDPRVRRAQQIREAVLRELRQQSTHYGTTAGGARLVLHDVRVAADHLHALVSRSSIGPVSREQVGRALRRLRKDGRAECHNGFWRAAS